MLHHANFCVLLDLFNLIRKCLEHVVGNCVRQRYKHGIRKDTKSKSIVQCVSLYFVQSYAGNWPDQ